MKAHADKAKLDKLRSVIRELQALATQHGINDISRTTTASSCKC